MGLAELLEPFPWSSYSKKIGARLLKLRSAGHFEERASQQRGMRVVRGHAGEVEEGNALCIYWLIDREDGVIVDAKFCAFGQTALLAAADMACELCVGKNYDQARRLSIELIDKSLRDKPQNIAFPKETRPHLQLVIDALQQAAARCGDLPLATSYIAAPIPDEKLQVQGEGYPGWFELSFQQQVALIEQVLDDEVRPYIAMDAGGVHVVELREGRLLRISYSGSCTSCYASVGTTLSYIQQVLRAKVSPELVVIPEL